MYFAKKKFLHQRDREKKKMAKKMLQRVENNIVFLQMNSKIKLRGSLEGEWVGGAKYIPLRFLVHLESVDFQTFPSDKNAKSKYTSYCHYEKELI